MPRAAMRRLLYGSAALVLVALSLGSCGLRPILPPLEVPDTPLPASLPPPPQSYPAAPVLTQAPAPVNPMGLRRITPSGYESYAAPADLYPPPSYSAGRAPPQTMTTEPLLIQSAPTIYGQPGEGSYAAPASSPWVSGGVPGRGLPQPSGLGGYVIGPGDTVQVEVLGRPELSAKGNVAGDGRVTVALVGAVHIAGLTPVQAAERIAGAYRQGQYLVAPQVTVTITDYQSQVLTVLGEVRNPGRFPLRARVSVLDALALAGGVNEQGASTAYLLRPERGTVKRYAVDLESLIQSATGQQYYEMLAGDTLLVPKTEVFYIYGEVKNPNAYKLKPGMTVIQALSLAGGLTERGSDKRIDLRRGSAGGALRNYSATLNDALRPDDVIYVRERLF